MQARYYDVDAARFLSSDTIVQDPNKPVTFNRYHYAGNNPVNNVDYDGHGWFKKFFGAFIGVIVAIVTAPVLGPAASGALGAYVGSRIAGANRQDALIAGAIGAVAGGLFGVPGSAEGAILGESARQTLGTGLLIGGAAYAAANGSFEDFVASAVGAAFGVGFTNAFLRQDQPGGASAAGAIDDAVEANPSDLQGAIDTGRNVGGETGAAQAGQSISKVEIDVRGALEKTAVAGALDGGAKVKVKVPYAHKGAVAGSVGRAGVFRGGIKSIANRAINALGVAANYLGKTLNALDAFKYGKSSIAAFNRGDYLTFSHDGGMAGLSLIGVAPGIGRAAPYIATWGDVGTKAIGNGIYGQ